MKKITSFASILFLFLAYSSINQICHAAILPIQVDKIGIKFSDPEIMFVFGIGLLLMSSFVRSKFKGLKELIRHLKNGLGARSLDDIMGGTAPVPTLKNLVEDHATPVKG